MECGFCGNQNGYAFEGLLICPACAREIKLSLRPYRDEIHATLEWRGSRQYLYTASIADAGQADQVRRLRAHQNTLALIGEAG